MTDEKTEDCPHCGEDITDTVAGLKSAVQNLRDEKKTEVRETREKLQAQIDGLEKKLDGIGSEHTTEVEKLKTEIETLTTKAGSATELQEQIETLKTEHTAAIEKATTDHVAEIADRDGKITKLTRKAEDGQIAVAISEAGGNVGVLGVHARQIHEDHPGMSFEDIATQLRNDETFSGNFRATQHSGGGTGPAKGGDGPTANAPRGVSKYPATRSQMTERQKVDCQKEIGLDAYLDIPE